MAAQSRYSNKARTGKGRGSQVRSHPWRVLGSLLLTMLILGGALAYTATRTTEDGPKGAWLPKLGLDLQGGTSITLSPRADGGAAVTESSIQQATEIIRQRVDGFGVAEAEVTPQGSGGDRKIVVSMPGEKDENLIKLVQQSAQLRFRKVLNVAAGVRGAGGSEMAGQGLPNALPEGVTTEAPGQNPTAPATGGTGTTGTGTPRATTSPAAPATTTSPAGWTPSRSGQPVVSSGVVKADPAVGVGGSAEVMQPIALRQTAGPLAATPPSAPPTTSATPATPSPATPAPATTPGTPVPTGTGTGTGTGTSATPGATTSQPPVAPTAPLTNAQVEQLFVDLDCSTREVIEANPRRDDPAQRIAACGVKLDGQPTGEKYLLDKAHLVGTDITSANAGLQTGPQGQPTGEWAVNVTFNGNGARILADYSRANVGQRDGIVLDGKVISAPTIQGVMPTGDMQITGAFDRENSQSLANALKYGALPLSFTTDSIVEISPTLGTKQLQAGLLAGLIGLILVILYSLLYYRALGLVNAVSLFVSMALTWLTVTLMSNLLGLRLSLAGVAGLVIGIGIAADSFVVYFERLRDEIRGGKSLRVAAEVAWQRARRTIVAADFVSLLAAIVLYFLAVGSVRGFAVMLGIATIIDIVVVFLFTKPVVTLLARLPFFSERRRMSGLAETGRRRPGEDSEGAPQQAGRPVRQGA